MNLYNIGTTRFEVMKKDLNEYPPGMFIQTKLKLIGTKDEMDRYKRSLELDFRIGRKARRGVKGDRASRYIGYKNVDVTSGSMVTLCGKRRFGTSFSPMNLGPVTLDMLVQSDENKWKTIHSNIVCYRFEQFWQYLKVYPELGHIDSYGNITTEWYRWRDAGFRIDDRKRRAKGVTSGMAPSYHYFNNTKLGIEESRRQIYVPFYIQLVKQLPEFDQLLSTIRSGTKIMLIDGDGPRNDQKEMDLGILGEERNIMKFISGKNPFGHGFVLGLALLQSV